MFDRILNLCFHNLPCSEAATGSVLYKNVFSKLLQNLQEKTNLNSLFNKSADLKA